MSITSLNLASNSLCIETGSAVRLPCNEVVCCITHEHINSTLAMLPFRHLCWCSACGYVLQDGEVDGEFELMAAAAMLGLMPPLQAVEQTAVLARPQSHVTASCHCLPTCCNHADDCCSFVHSLCHNTSHRHCVISDYVCTVCVQDGVLLVYHKLKRAWE